MIRNLQFGDLERLKEIHPKEFPFPNLSSGLYCVQKAIVNDDKLIGAALLRLTCEAVLILDPELSVLTKAVSILEAFPKLKSEAIGKYGLDQVHVFVVPEKDEHYVKILQKHFGFVKAEGFPLVLTKEG